jgi:hypothetical protein
MRRETPLVLALVAILAIVVSGPAGSAATGSSPVASQHSAGGFTLVAALIAVLVATRYRALQH